MRLRTRSGGVPRFPLPIVPSTEPPTQRVQKGSELAEAVRRRLGRQNVHYFEIPTESAESEVAAAYRQ